MLSKRKQASLEKQVEATGILRFGKVTALTVLVGTVTVVLALLLIESFRGSWFQRGVETANAKSEKGLKVLSFASDVMDGTAHLVVRGGQFWIESKENKPIEHPWVRIVNEFPRDDECHAEVHTSTSRPLVAVIQQPTKSNNFELRVLIRGSEGAGAELVTFDVYAVHTAEFKHRYNVVIITVDTLRPDHLGCYGYARATSPNLDAFAKQAVLFENAFSTSSFTPPAHASLFTSKYVGDHGLLTWNKLPDEEVTLAEVLKDCGFVTVASINLAMLKWQDLGQGFDFRKEGGIRDGREIIEDGLEIIRTPTDTPFFIWLHLYDAHRPYCRDPNWTKCFNSEGRDGVGDLEQHYNLWSHQSRKVGSNLDESGLSKADLQFIADRYDAGIAYTDSVLGVLFDELSTPSRLKDTMIILTSDHGENLLEHRECLFSHDPFLYSVATRIPLLIRYPQAHGGGRTLDTVVSLIDLAPTVMDVIGLPVPPSFNMGRSLVPLLKGENNWPRQQIFMECWGWERLKAVRSKSQLIIHDTRDNETVFFDLTKDSAELRPTQEPQDEIAARLHEDLVEFSQRIDMEMEVPELDPQVVRKLRSLGYIQ